MIYTHTMCVVHTTIHINMRIQYTCDGLYIYRPHSTHEHHHHHRQQDRSRSHSNQLSLWNSNWNRNAAFSRYLECCWNGRRELLRAGWSCSSLRNTSLSTHFERCTSLFHLPHLSTHLNWLWNARRSFHLFGTITKACFNHSTISISILLNTVPRPSDIMAKYGFIVVAAVLMAMTVQQGTCGEYCALVVPFASTSHTFTHDECCFFCSVYIN